MPISLHSKLAWAWCAGVVVFYGTACATPAIDFGPQKGGPEGLHGVKLGGVALATGWINLVAVGSPALTPADKVTMLVWLANPLGLVGVILLACRTPIPAAVAGAMATGLCAWYLVFPFGQPLVGAYLWAASAGLLVLGAAAVWLVRKQTAVPRAAPGTSSGDEAS